MNENPVIRRAESGDCARLAVLSTELGYAATEEDIRKRLTALQNDEHHAVYVAVLPRGGVLGWIHLHVRKLLVSETQVEVDGLVVDESHRGKGIGTHLMNWAEQWARERGCRIVRLNSYIGREDAHRFYERLGYRNVRTQHVFRKVI